LVGLLTGAYIPLLTAHLADSGIVPSKYIHTDNVLPSMRFHCSSRAVLAHRSEVTESAAQYSHIILNYGIADNSVAQALPLRLPVSVLYQPLPHYPQACTSLLFCTFVFLRMPTSLVRAECRH
jgi:hypothetical protein